MRGLILSAALVAGAATASCPAAAHAMLVTATPRVGSTVSIAPAEVHLDFSEGVDVHFSGVEVTAPDGRSAAAGQIQVSGAGVTLPLVKGLRPGTYKVKWHVVSVDTHKTEGSFTFEIRP